MKTKATFIARHAPRISLAAALALGACAGFADVSTVIDLRVLSVVTDPSEVFLKVTGLPADPLTPVDPLGLGIDPASIPTIHLKTLVVNPAPAAAGRALTYDLVACPNNPYGAAPPAAMGGNPDPSGGARTTVGSSLCKEGAATTWPLGKGVPADGSELPFTLTPEQLLAAFKSDVYLDQDGRPHGGFDLGMPLNLQLTVTDGVDTVVALKRVLFWAQRLSVEAPDHTTHTQKENVAPTLMTIHTYADRTPEAWDPIEPIGTLDDPKVPAHVALGTGLWLEPIPAPGAVEDYVTTVIERDPPHLAVPDYVPRERLRYAFYATAGHFDPPRTNSEQIPGVVGPVHLESHYLPPATLDDVPPDASGAHVVKVWIVVRDDRGGEIWYDRQLVLE